MLVEPGGDHVPIGAEMPEGARFIGPVEGLEPSWRFPLDAPCRRRSRRVRRVRPVPPPLPDVPGDRRGVGLAARTDRRDAFGRRGPVRTRRDVRRIHGSVPRLSRVRGRVPLACAVRPNGRARSRADRAAPNATSAVPAMARARRRAPEEEAALARRGAAAAGASRPAPARPAARAETVRAVPPTPARHRAERRAARDGRAALGLRAGPMVPQRQPSDDPGARPERLAGRRAEGATMLRRPRRASRPARHRPRARRTQHAGVRRRRRRRRERGRVRFTPEGGRRPARNARRRRVLGQGPRRAGVPARRGALGDAVGQPRSGARRLPRRVPRAPGPADPRTAAKHPSNDPGSRDRRGPRWRRVLRGRRPLQRARTRDVVGASETQGRGDRLDPHECRRERQPGLHDADRRRASASSAHASRSRTRSRSWIGRTRPRRRPRPPPATRTTSRAPEPPWRCRS